MQNMILCLLQTNNQMMKIKSQPLDQLKVVYMRLDILPRWDVSSEWDPFYPAFTREKLFLKWITLSHVIITMKPLNSGHLQVLKNLTVIERCPLLRGNLKRLTFGTTVLSAIQGMSAIWDARYWEVSLYN